MRSHRHWDNGDPFLAGWQVEKRDFFDRRRRRAGGGVRDDCHPTRRSRSDAGSGLDRATPPPWASGSFFLGWLPGSGRPQRPAQYVYPARPHSLDCPSLCLSLFLFRFHFTFSFFNRLLLARPVGKLGVAKSPRRVLFGEGTRTLRSHSFTADYD
jgi:hypothetical protein